MAFGLAAGLRTGDIVELVFELDLEFALANASKRFKAEMEVESMEVESAEATEQTARRTKRSSLGEHRTFELLESSEHKVSFNTVLSPIT